MKLEVGKRYVIQRTQNRTTIGRCICTDRKMSDGRRLAMFLYDYDGGEECVYTLADGGEFANCSVVKEYTPPLRVRLVVMRKSGLCVTLSTVEGGEEFVEPRWPYFTDQWTRLSDTIVEVPINGQAGA